MEVTSSISQVHGSTIKQKKEEGWCVFYVIYVVLTKEQTIKLRTLEKSLMEGNPSFLVFSFSLFQSISPFVL